LVDGVSITELSGPSIVEAGKELLDCHFTYTEDEPNQLVVKWFYNGSHHPFYQWVPGLDIGPQIISPEFKDLVDLSYSVKGEDRYTQYRALRIPSASLAVAGTYKCQVSSFTVETHMETQVNVFVPPTYMYVETSLIPVSTPADRNESVSSPVLMSCSGGPAFPAPTLTLNWTQNLESHTSSTPATIVEDESGLFSAMLNVSISGDTVGPEDVVQCTMDLPGTEYTRTEQTEILEIIYYADVEEAMELEDDTEDIHTPDYLNSTEVFTSNITGNVSDYDFISTSDLDKLSEESINVHDTSRGSSPAALCVCCSLHPLLILTLIVLLHTFT